MADSQSYADRVRAADRSRFLALPIEVQVDILRSGQDSETMAFRGLYDKVKGLEKEVAVLKKQCIQVDGRGVIKDSRMANALKEVVLEDAVNAAHESHDCDDWHGGDDSDESGILEKQNQERDSKIEDLLERIKELESNDGAPRKRKKKQQPRRKIKRPVDEGEQEEEKEKKSAPVRGEGGGGGGGGAEPADEEKKKNAERQRLRRQKDKLHEKGECKDSCDRCAAGLWTKGTSYAGWRTAEKRLKRPHDALGRHVGDPGCTLDD